MFETAILGIWSLLSSRSPVEIGAKAQRAMKRALESPRAFQEVTMSTVRPALFAAALLLAGSAIAAGDKCPLDTFLTVSGKITRHNDPAAQVFRFSEADLLRLPASSLHTSTVWTPLTTYTGPTLAAILQAAGAEPTAKQLHLVALDDFESSVPYNDIQHYAPIVAHTMNGRRISNEKYGPLFLVYPRDAHAELQNPKAESRFVWELCRIDVR